MKCLVVLLLWGCAVQSTLGEIRTAGRVIRRGILGRALLQITDVCKNSSTVGQQFCNGSPICDANAVLLCTSSNGGSTIPCPTNKPYCTSTALGKAECSDKPAEQCPAVEPAFQCTGIGNYPDPSNCKMYYNCYKDENGDIKPEAILCPSGYVFDPNSATKQFCLYTSIASKCVTVTGCDGATTIKNVPINFSNNALFVALCIPDSQPLIFQCPTGTKANLDDVPVTCTFTCKTQGQFEYTLDNKYYYDCRLDSAKKLYSELKPCPLGHVFEKTVCVRL